jgi:hypothetical protein
VSYAGCIYYHAYEYQTAFLFAVVTMLIGSAVAIRGALVSIAVLSQIGGHIAPFVLSQGQPPGVPLLGYVLMLEIVALILAQWGESPKWWLLRVLSLAATAMWVVLAFMGGRWAHGLGNEVLLFSLLYAAGYQGDVLRSALRLRPTTAAEITRGWGTVFSLLVTAGLTAVVLVAFADYPNGLWRGGPILVLAAATLAGGFLVRPRDNPIADGLVVGYRIQGVALIVLFVPVTFSGLWISLAWAVLGLAFAVIAAHFDRGLARGTSLAVWWLAILWLLTDATTGGASHGTWLSLFGQPIQGETATAWLLAVAGQMVVWLFHVSPTGTSRKATGLWRFIVWSTSAVATAVWIIAATAALPRLGATLAIIVWAWLLVAADYVPPRVGFPLQAFVVLLIGAFKWILFDTLEERITLGWNPLQYLPFLNPIMGMGTLIALSLGGVAWLREGSLPGSMPASHRRDSENLWPFAVACLVLGLVTFGLSVEVDRAVERMVALKYSLVWPPGQLKLLAWTWLWLAMVMVLACTRRWLVFPSEVPWILALLVVAKFLVMDMLMDRFNLPERGPVPVYPVFNLQVLTAVPVLGVPLLLPLLVPLKRSRDDLARLIRDLANLLALLVLLCAGTLEIDRAFAGTLANSLSDPKLARQVAISIFWSLFALGVVAAGFYFRAAWLRYFGLVLFGVTLIKVGVMDLAEVKYGYRVLALLGLGLLLLATSVLYGKLNPLLLGVTGEGRGAREGSAAETDE